MTDAEMVTAWQSGQRIFNIGTLNANSGNTNVYFPGCIITADTINIINNTIFSVSNSVLMVTGEVNCSSGTLKTATSNVSISRLICGNKSSASASGFEAGECTLCIDSLESTAQVSISGCASHITFLTNNGANRISVGGTASMQFIEINNSSGRVVLSGVGTYYECSGSTSRLQKNGTWYVG